jgi:methylenetetrahydrofolate dehydrogenase (NADP+) / methenyltetrahydrofolate cyclohydrolase
MTILSGKSLRPSLLAELKAMADGKKFSYFLFSDKDSLTSFYYLKGVKKALEECGIPYTEAFVDKSLSAEAAIAAFKVQSAGKQTVIGRPLGVPYEKALIQCLDMRCDPDRMTDMNRARLIAGDLDSLPATAQSVRTILTRYAIPLVGKKVLVIGRSLTVGWPLAQFFLASDSAVTVVHSKVSLDVIDSYVRQSDIIVLASGHSGLVRRESLSPQSIIVDCGFNANGGDLGFVPAENEVAAYTPVPGGVGSLTSLCLIANSLASLRKDI